MASRPPQAATTLDAPPDEPRLPLGGRTILVPLERLDDNPFQHRSEIEEEKLDELAASIAASGLLQAIAVRAVGERFQVIAGHRRAAAFKLLFERAASDKERRQWAAIPAMERSATDEEMHRLGLTENLQRDDPSALDAAASLAAYQARYELTTSQLAERLSLELTRVKRLLQLNGSPAVVKAGVTRGLKVPVLDETGQPVLTPQGKPRHRRLRLDLHAALEFQRLHAHWADENPRRADERIEALIKRTLTEGWGLRRIASYCASVRDRRDAGPEGGDAPGGPAKARPLYVDRGGDLLIKKGLLAQATSAQVAELRQLLHSLIAQLPDASS